MIAQTFLNISIVASDGSTEVTSEYHNLEITQEITEMECNLVCEFLNSDGLCEKRPDLSESESLLYGCTNNFKPFLMSDI